MSLDISIGRTFSANITHNLTAMANAVGLYNPVWYPEKVEISKAKQLIPLLTAGLEKLKANPSRYKIYEQTNKWGTYDDFVPWLETLLTACKKNPRGKIYVFR